MEDIGAVASLVQEPELIRGAVVLEVRRLGGAFEPLNPFAIAVPEAHVADEAGAAEAGGGARVVFTGRLAVELHGFGRVLARAPAKLVAKRGAVAGFSVTVLGCRHEKGEGAIVVFFAFAEEARGEAVG